MEANSCYQSSPCHETLREAVCQSPVQSYKPLISSESFEPTEKKLRSSLADARAQQEALRSDVRTARVFGIPLLSDALAIKVADLLSRSQPQIVEANVNLEEASEEEDIYWLDLIQEPHFEPQCQNDGNYQCRIQKRNALVEMSAWDHDLVVTCRQLVYTQTYLCDMLAEKDTLELMARALTSCNEIATEFIKTNQDTLAQITGKLQPLQHNLSRLAWTHHAPLSGFERDSTSEEDRTARPDETASESSEEGSSSVKPEASPHSSRWTPQELKRLPSWFKPREHLPNDILAEQFEKDFSRSRSGGAIRAAAWREEKKNPKPRSNRKRRARTGASGSALDATTTAALKTQSPGRAQSPGTLAEKSTPGQGLFPPAFTRNILTATVQAHPEQLRAERAASDTHDEDQDRGPVPENDKGYQQTHKDAGTRASSSEQTVTDNGFLHQPNDGMNYQRYGHGGNDKPAFTPADFPGDRNITLSVRNHSSPPMHFIQIQNVR